MKILAVVLTIFLSIGIFFSLSDEKSDENPAAENKYGLKKVLRKQKKSVEEFQPYEVTSIQQIDPNAVSNSEQVTSKIQNDNEILGSAVATQNQCVRYLLANNPVPKISVSPQKLVEYYYDEATREGIRADVAFAQAIHETNFFRFDGTVTPAQNNYCGLGTTSSTNQGAYFSTAQLGVRAHIQHLLAYMTRVPTQPIIDPRFEMVFERQYRKTRWTDLNGSWAIPGIGYGQTILDTYRKILNVR